MVLFRDRGKKTKYWGESSQETGKPSLTISVTLLGTYAGHPAFTQGKPSFSYPLLL